MTSINQNNLFQKVLEVFFRYSTPADLMKTLLQVLIDKGEVEKVLVENTGQ